MTDRENDSTDKTIARELQGIADAIRDSLLPPHRAPVNAVNARLRNVIAEQQADIDQLREALQTQTARATEEMPEVRLRIARAIWPGTLADSSVQEIVAGITELRRDWTAQTELARAARQAAADTQRRCDKLLADAKTQRDKLQAAVNAARDEVVEGEHEITKLRLAKAIQSRTPTGELSDAVARLNEVIARQIEWTRDAGSGAARAVDIRRRQLAEYSPEHDRNHGAETLATAAVALAAPLYGFAGHWPWGIERFRELVDSPDRLAHASALLMAAYDVEQAETGESQ